MAGVSPAGPQAARRLLFFTIKAMGIHISRMLVGLALCFEKKHHPGCLEENGWRSRRWLLLDANAQRLLQEMRTA